MVRYYGLYSNVSRGKRKKEEVEEEPTDVTEVPPPLVSKELKRRWPHFILHLSLSLCLPRSIVMVRIRLEPHPKRPVVGIGLLQGPML